MSLSSTQKPAWYEHTLRNERCEVVSTIIADYEKGPAFGKPDVDYDKLFTVVVVPLYYPDEVERLRAELGEAKGEYDRSANKVAALTDQLAAFEALHGGELGLPKEGWPEYHKRKMESLSELTAARYERKLAERDGLLREMRDLATAIPVLMLAVPDPHDAASRDKHIDSVNALIKKCDITLSASAEPVSDLCAEGAHEFVPFQDKCVKCSEPYQAAPAPKISPAALREAMENLAVKARAADLPPFFLPAAVRQAPLVMLGGVCVRVSCSGLKWYHDQLIDGRWEPLAVEEFDELLTEALAKS